MRSSIMSNKFILFVSPWETPSSEWEMITFDTQDEMEKYISYYDLTKEHYMFPFDILLQAMSDFCDKEEE